MLSDATTLWMNAAASRMSSQHFGALGCMEQLPGLIDAVDKIRIPLCSYHHQVDRAAKERLQRFPQAEILLETA